MRNRTNLLIGLAALLAVGVFYLKRKPDTSAADARQLVAAGARLVDVRSPGEYAAGHLPGAVNVPVDQLVNRLADVGPADHPVVVYCASGMRSASAARLLMEHGYASVHNLGAMSNW